MHHHLRRIVPALTAVGIAAATPLVLAGTAQAHAVKTCDDAQISYSLDNGETWTTAGRFGKPVERILVKLTGEVGDGCDYPVSLAAYDTQGASWTTSGQQTLAGWATGTLNNKNPQVTLDVTGSLGAGCFGQIDLYNSDRKFAGDDAPHYPKGVFGRDTDQPLIAAWNGGTKDCTPAPTPAPSQSTPAGSPSTPAGTPSTPAGTPSTPAGTPSTPAQPSAKPSASTPAGGVPTATASASTSTPATPVDSTSTTPPVGSPAVKPTSTTPTKLAFTGTNGSALTGVAIGGAALLVVGAGAVVIARRRSAGAN